MHKLHQIQQLVEVYAKVVILLAVLVPVLAQLSVLGVNRDCIYLIINVSQYAQLENMQVN